MTRTKFFAIATVVAATISAASFVTPAAASSYSAPSIEHSSIKAQEPRPAVAKVWVVFRDNFKSKQTCEGFRFIQDEYWERTGTRGIIDLTKCTKDGKTGKWVFWIHVADGYGGK